MILFLEWEGHSVLASSCFRVKYAAFSFQTPHTRMLSRLAGPVLRGPGALLSSNIYCIAPATFTTLHGSTSATVKPNKQRQARFSPTTGVTIGDYQPVSDTKLFHVTRPTPNLKSDWEQVKKMYLHDTGILYKLKGYSPRALTAKAPKEVQPYLQLMRFDRPTGSWLLYLPCTWSIALAAHPGHLPSVTMLALFGAGSLLMRGAGCTINDMWDVDFDKRVARTRDRPLASGRISNTNAFLFLGLQLSASLAILMCLNSYSVVLGICSVGLVAAYPLMKRYTYWPQAFLGLTLNWGALMGYAAVQGHCAWSVVLPLYASCIAWTLFYDTIYAHQDKNDDLMIGVKSTALLFGDDTKDWLARFGAAMVGGLFLTGLASHQTFPYFLGVGYVAYHLHWQWKTVNLNNPDDCFDKFKSNRNLGLVLLAAIILGTGFKERQAYQYEIAP